MSTVEVDRADCVLQGPERTLLRGHHLHGGRLLVAQRDVLLLDVDVLRRGLLRGLGIDDTIGARREPRADETRRQHRHRRKAHILHSK
jgi:hypothetical protein